MGWDAYAEIKKNTQEEIFKNAVKNVKRLSSVICNFMINDLHNGCLDSSLINIMLSRAVMPMASVYDEDGWSAEDVRQINKNANWNFDYRYDENGEMYYNEECIECAFYTAKYFLKACANAGVGIRFSW